MKGNDFIKKHLDTSYFPPFSISEINDFVKLKTKVLCEKLFFGKYHLKESFGYLSDLVGCEVFILDKQKIPDKNLKKDLLDNFAKIIAIKIVSRHKRGKNKGVFRKIYKVFIEYEPNELSLTEIKSNIYKIFIF